MALYRRQSTQQVLAFRAEDEIGKGGEASVYRVSGAPPLVAKVYHTAEHAEVRARKLAVMIDSPPADPMAAQGHASIAWPCDLIVAQDGSVAGFLMPRVSGMHPIIDFYHPAARKKQCPLFTWQYLLRTAHNLAAAVRALHLRGYVIGDINESNILVSDVALVTLVDTDSFQVRDPHSNQYFRCPVGKPDFTPPELQSVSFRDVDRSREHDLFGLAVVIFKLLMEGTHPFDGVFEGPDDPPTLEKRIKAGLYPHGNKKTPVQPKPGAPPFKMLPVALQTLFRTCFETGHAAPASRPDALAWQQALDAAESSLTACKRNPQHQYGKHLRSCPWCERTTLLQGMDPFPSQSDVQSGAYLSRTPLAQKPLPSAKTPPGSPVPSPLSLRPATRPPGNILPLLPVKGNAGSPGRFRFGARHCLGIVALWAVLVAGGKLLPAFRPTLAAPANRAMLHQIHKNPIDRAELVWIPPGSFAMGDKDRTDNPRHQVTLSGYWIYKYPVTVAQYKRFCIRTGHKLPPAPSFDRVWFQDDHPIVNVSWNDAQEYCKWAGVSLPTEAQWEKAARGPNGSLFPWGNTYDTSKIWSQIGTAKLAGTASVTRSNRASESYYGCVDMAGNVMQWCQDTYDENYWFNSAPAENPVNTNWGDTHVSRGGGFNTAGPDAFRSSRRYRSQPDSRLDVYGFRCAVAGS